MSDVIFLDLSKSFNSVPQERLLLKLNRYGIDGKLHLWFRNFLTNRKQRGQIRGSYSEWSPVISGSILGPIMFLIYVNDIPNIITSTARLFADDIKIYRQVGECHQITEGLFWQACRGFGQKVCTTGRLIHRSQK